jgi:hypothetical protein
LGIGFSFGGAYWGRATISIRNNLNPQTISIKELRNMAHIDPWLALGVSVSTAVTDAVYVLFNAAVSSRRRLPAATWSSVWYLLSAFAVISYTRNWLYVGFAAAGSWIGAYASLTLLREADMRKHPGPI